MSFLNKNNVYCYTIPVVSEKNMGYICRINVVSELNIR